MNLVHELETLLDAAKRKHYHDFASVLTTPKIVLRDVFLNLAQRVIDGDFDN
jgi:hypothetical protein